MASKIYRTPKPLITQLIELVKPRSGETIYDPACGIGSLLVEARAYIMKQRKLSPEEILILDNKSLYGREIDKTTYTHAIEFFDVLGISTCNILRVDTLRDWKSNPTFPKKFNVVVSNAPFNTDGFKANASQQRAFSSEDFIPTEYLELLFLQHAIDSVEDGGRCAIIMPNEVIESTEPKFSQVKEKLLNECKQIKIIEVENFNRTNSRNNSSIIYFVKGKLEDNITYRNTKDVSFEISKTVIHDRKLNLIPKGESEILPHVISSVEPLVFINYRHTDTEWPAHRLYDYLKDHLERKIFIDFDGIEQGEDFEQKIQVKLQRCKVLIAMIGKSWIDATNISRLKDRKDWVRKEIISALQKGITIIPVLVDDVLFPKTEVLPSEFEKFTSKNAAKLRAGKDFVKDASEIVKSINSIV